MFLSLKISSRNIATLSHWVGWILKKGRPVIIMALTLPVWPTERSSSDGEHGRQDSAGDHCGW